MRTLIALAAFVTLVTAAHAQQNDATTAANPSEVEGSSELDFGEESEECAEPAEEEECQNPQNRRTRHCG